MRFKDRFNRLYMLELNKSCYVSDRWENGVWKWNWRHECMRGMQEIQFLEMENLLHQMHIQDRNDYVKWNMGDINEFMVKDVRKWIDDSNLPDDTCYTEWISCVPRKVNIFVWRLGKNRLPTREKINEKGIDIPSLLCPTCGVAT